MENKLYDLRILRQASNGIADSVMGGIGYLAEIYENGVMFAAASVRSGCKLPNDRTMIPIEVNPVQELNGSRVTAFIPKDASLYAGISSAYEGRSLDLIFRD